MSVQDGPTFKRYAANGVATVYAIPFLLLSADDLIITLDDIEVMSGFTLSGIGNPTSSCTFAVAPSGDLLFRLDITLQRLLDYQELGDFLAATVNNDFDRLWLAVKQVSGDNARSLSTSALEPEGVAPLPFAADRMLKLLAFDDSGNPVPSSLTLEQIEQQPALAQASAEDAAASAAAAEAAASMVSGTGALTLPGGTTAERPGVPAAGMVRRNNTTGLLEGYGSAWGSLFTGENTNLAYGVAASPWAAGHSTFDLGTFGISSSQSGVLTFLGSNIYFDGTNYKHKINGVGHVMTFGALGIPLVFSAAAAGTAGNNASLVTMFAIDANGLVAVSSPTGGLGYGAGAGGAVTQITNKSTGVTLNRPCGQITMSGASLAASTAVSFTLTNSLITATDNIDANIQSGAATGGSYNLTVDAVAAGSCRVSLRNMTAGALAEALVLNISVKKSVNA